MLIKTPEKQKLNFSRSALFRMKTRVSLKYFVNDCRMGAKNMFSTPFSKLTLFMHNYNISSISDQQTLVFIYLSSYMCLRVTLIVHSNGTIANNNLISNKKLKSRCNFLEFHFLDKIYSAFDGNLQCHKSYMKISLLVRVIYIHSLKNMA